VRGTGDDNPFLLLRKLSHVRGGGGIEDGYGAEIRRPCRNGYHSPVIKAFALVAVSILHKEYIMKQALFTIIIFSILGFSLPALADTFVNGYYKSNGTYVAPHYRSSPNSTTTDNWSTQGNTNPYTGQRGTRSNSYQPQYPGLDKRLKPSQPPMFGNK